MDSKLILLLDYTLDLPAMVSFFVKDDAGGSFGKCHHGMNKNTVKVNLKKLFDLGFIFFKDETERKVHIDSVDQIYDELVVNITKKGGDFCENKFCIKWEKFVLLEEEFIDNTNIIKATISSHNKKLLLPLIKKISQDVNAYNISKLLKISPWKPLYWKSLDFGYELSFSFDVDVDVGIDLDYPTKIIPDMLDNKWRKDFDDQ